VTNAVSTRTAVDSILSRTGRIDILVNNAGIAGRAISIGEQTEEDWQPFFAVNMTGVFLSTRALVRTRILDQLAPEEIFYMTDKIPMRRASRPDGIAAVVHFLASPDCSFVTRQCYDASGGRATY
jgi:NAD(P)-dependent dehydrogenase (short-subunit alcohol dehydrogenase family)